MNPAQEPFLIAEVAVDATDQTIRTLTRMLDRAHRAGRHKHFICSVTGVDRDGPSPWERPAFVALCTRLLDAGLVAYLDFSTLHPPGQPEHLQTGFGGLEVWQVSRGLFGAVPTAAMLDQAKADLDRAHAVAAAVVAAG